MREVRKISRKLESLSRTRRARGSSETVRQTIHAKTGEGWMRQSDLHGDMESTAEMPVPRETNLKYYLKFGFAE